MVSISCFCGEGAKGGGYFVPKRRCSITKISIGEFESRSEFRMSQIKIVSGVCGTSVLNILETIEIGSVALCNRWEITKVILALNALYNFKQVE